jgi:hypothetical protein
MFKLYIVTKYIIILNFFNKTNNQTLKKVNDDNKKKNERVHDGLLFR